MKTLLITTAALTFTAGMALADITASQLVTAYQAQGYTAIEVTTGPSQIKVEAVLDRTKVEAIYDIATGTILKQEQQRARRSEAMGLVEVKATTKDFLAAGHNDGRDDAEDVNDDHGTDANGTHGDDDGAENEHGSGHDVGTDDSGHDNSGRDDSGRDDSGRDDSGNDDGGNDNSGHDGSSHDDSGSGSDD